MSYTEEDWIDEDATSHREPDPTLPLPLQGGGLGGGWGEVRE